MSELSPDDKILEELDKVMKLYAPCINLQDITFKPRIADALKEIKEKRLTRKQLQEMLAEKSVLLDILSYSQLAFGFSLVEMPAELQIAISASKAEAIKTAKSQHAKKAAEGKLKNDHKQIAKKEVLLCWQKWQNEPHQYKSKAEFARDMLDKYEELNSSATIEDWCRKWGKDPPSMHGT